MFILVYDLVVAQKLRDVEEEGGGPSDPGTGAAAAPTEGGGEVEIDSDRSTRNAKNTERGIGRKERRR